MAKTKVASHYHVEEKDDARSLEFRVCGLLCAQDVWVGLGQVWAKFGVSW